MAENKNHMGLDKFQITVIKSNYNSTKPIRKLMEKTEGKIAAAKEKLDAAVEAAQKKYEEAVKNLESEVKAYTTQIEMLDKFTMETTKTACGIELSSEQVIQFLDDEAAFNAFKNEKLGPSMFDENTANLPAENPVDDLPWNEAKDLDAEEDKDWEDKINSGELKEAV